MNSRLKHQKLLLLDMDGTIYIDDVLFEYSIPFLDLIRSKGGEYIFLTSNYSTRVNDYMEKLSKLGISVTNSNVLTSSQATALYLKENYRDKKIYLMGTKSLKK